MTNKLLIEALEYGSTIVKNYERYFLFCSEICEKCIFDDNKGNCRILKDGGDSVTEENIEFLKEKYPEYLLKV